MERCRSGPRRFTTVLAALTLFAAIPAKADSVSDAYIAGYAAAILERDFHISTASLTVRDQVIALDADAVAGANRDQLIEALRQIRGVRRVDLRDLPAPAATATASATPPRATQAAETPAPAAAPGRQASGDLANGAIRLLPRDRLFEPLMADPRWPHFAASFLHINNSPELESGAAVSFGEVFPLLEADAPFGGKLQIGILGSVFSLFDTGSTSEDLINTDYFIGVPIDWRNGNWSAQLRYFHQSSHLGDEFLLRGTGVTRVNLSYEQADLRLSYDLNDEFRLYGGGGAILRSDPHREHLVAQGGAEYGANWRFLDGLLRPVAGLDLQSREFQHWQPDLSLRGGVELGSPFGIGRKVQLLLEYYNGKAPWGQFLNENVEYYGLGAHFYF